MSERQWDLEYLQRLQRRRRLWWLVLWLFRPMRDLSCAHVDRGQLGFRGDDYWWFCLRCGKAMREDDWMPAVAAMRKAAAKALDEHKKVDYDMG